MGASTIGDLRKELFAILGQAIDIAAYTEADLEIWVGNQPLVSFLDKRYLGQATGGGGTGGSGPGPGGLEIIPQDDGTDLVIPTGITQLIHQPDGTDLLVAAGTVSIIPQSDGSDLVTS